MTMIRHGTMTPDDVTHDEVMMADGTRLGGQTGWQVGGWVGAGVCRCGWEGGRVGAGVGRLRYLVTRRIMHTKHCVTMPPVGTYAVI